MGQVDRAHPATGYFTVEGILRRQRVSQSVEKDGIRAA